MTVIRSTFATCTPTELKLKGAAFAQSPSSPITHPSQTAPLTSSPSRVMSKKRSSGLSRLTGAPRVNLPLRITSGESSSSAQPSVHVTNEDIEELFLNQRWHLDQFLRTLTIDQEDYILNNDDQYCKAAMLAMQIHVTSQQHVVQLWEKAWKTKDTSNFDMQKFNFQGSQLSNYFSAMSEGKIGLGKHEDSTELGRRFGISNNDIWSTATLNREMETLYQGWKKVKDDAYFHNIAILDRGSAKSINPKGELFKKYLVHIYIAKLLYDQFRDIRNVAYRKAKGDKDDDRVFPRGFKNRKEVNEPKKEDIKARAKKLQAWNQYFMTL